MLTFSSLFKKITISLFAVAIHITASPHLLSQTTLQINEFGARNNSIIADERDEFNDWIELYNFGTQPVNLAGFHITDDPAIPDKWRIPLNDPEQTTIPADDYIILWADGSPDEGLLHLNFKLNADGEEIGLYSPDGALVDFIRFGQQRADTSYGRHKETRQWQFFPVPTPGSANVDNVIIAPPQFSHDGGMYDGIVTVKLTAPNDTEIYFTLNGAEPRRESRYLYSRPIQLDETTVIRAKSVRGDRAWSEIRTETYIINEQLNLPVFSLATDPANFWGERGIYDHRFEGWEKPVHVDYFVNEGRVMSMNAGVKIHGPGTLDQQSLRLYARSRYGTDVFHYKFFDELAIHSFKRLVLRNGGNDCTNAGSRQTHLRDAVVHSLYRQRNPDYAMSAYQPVHVFLNGAYWGIYNLRERQDEFYIESHYGFKDIDFLEYAAEEGEENEKRNAIAGEWVAFEALIEFAQHNDLSIQNHYDAVAAQVDIVNFCEYWIFQTMVANYDWPFHNQKFFRSRMPGRKWQWVLWDTEFSLGHIWHGSYTWENLARSLSTNPNDKHLEKYPWFAQHRFVPELFKNAGFRTIFINRYYDCLNTTLSTHNMLKTIDSLTVLIQTDIKQQLARWGGSFTDWLNAVDDIRTFAEKRPAIAEQHLRDYFDLRAAVILTVNVSPVDAGAVQVNTITPTKYPWQGEYSPDIPVRVTAEAKPGYMFVGWRERQVEGETVEFLVKPRTSMTALFAPEGTSVRNTEIHSAQCSLKQNYPNPFNASTRIHYMISDRCNVKLAIYSITGQKVAELVDATLDAGAHKVSWDAAGFASGVYIIRLETATHSITRRMVLLE